ncbi:MAG: TetR/AcrR family transcriptional regulator [Solirubrobacterales bacterium]|jgi:AcrR family transcriptional regulator
MAATAPTPRRLSAADRRGALLAAAAREFGERGYSGTRLDVIAAAAGVTKPIVYRHFASKKDLYLALLARHEHDLAGFTERGLAAHGDEPPELMVRAILDDWLDYVRDNRHAWLMLFRDASGDAEIRAKRREVNVRAREVIAGFIAGTGTSVPADQVEPTAEMIVSGLAGLALWWIDEPEVPKPIVLDVAARVCAPAFA